ncbi:MAG: hypothetical protein ABI402_10340 [Ferruginibacter sp.]
MKTKLILFVLGIFYVSLASAKIWRVNLLSNVGGTAAYPVFNNLNDANSAANDGDTIHLEGIPPGTNRYPAAIITKRLIIIGTGFFLDENINTSLNQYSSRIESVQFSSGSYGSKLIGVWIYPSGALYIYTGAITIQRCKIDSRISIYDSSFIPLSDIVIIGNFFDDNGSGSNSAIVMNSGNSPAGLIIKNNIFKRRLLLQYNTTVGTIEQCDNNVFNAPNTTLLFNSNSCHNNIIRADNVIVQVGTTNPTGVSYNTSSPLSGLLGSASENNIYVDMNTLFVSPVTSSDGIYKLNPGSALGDDHVTERGVFGGSARPYYYTLSGLPPIPIIYQMSGSGIVDAAGLPVFIHAKTIQ